MKTAMKRPYKDDSPFRTVTKIRNILSNIGTLPYEVTWYQPYEDVYSVRIENDLQDGKFGTSGKGRNRPYTLASGYAEYIERLQNGLLAGTSFTRFFLNGIKEETGYFYYPDEKYLSREEFANLPDDFRTDISNRLGGFDEEIYYARLKENGYEGCLAVPFFDVKNQEVVDLPLNLVITLTGSNGMAAGNSVSEGLFQAICEILERYAASVIYNDQLTPPSIPRSYLAQFENEFALINAIEESGHYRVIVKDFSAGLGLPSLGVIIENEDSTRYRLNVGSDSSLQVALSRCLTEIHQGAGDLETFERAMLPIPKVEHDYFLKKDKKSQMLKSMQLLKFTVNGMGVFPKTLFGEEESYPFAPESFFTHDTYEAEVDRLTQLIIDLGYNVYLRDVSFLGFPSYYVYVPFMSPIGKKAMHGDKGIDSAVITANDRIEDLFFPFTDLTDEKVRHLTQLMDKTHDSKMKDALKVEFDQSSDWDSLPTSFFLTLFYYRLGEYKDALKSLKKFRKYENHEKESPAYKYYSAVQQFLELETRGVVGHEKRQHLIDAGHVPETVDSVIDCFSDKDKLFDRVSVPACPSCDECSLVNECLTKGKVGLAKRINLEMKKQPVSQAQFGMATA